MFYLLLFSSSLGLEDVSRISVFTESPSVGNLRSLLTVFKLIMHIYNT